MLISIIVKLMIKWF